MNGFDALTSSCCEFQTDGEMDEDVYSTSAAAGPWVARKGNLLPARKCSDRPAQTVQLLFGEDLIVGNQITRHFDILWGVDSHVLLYINQYCA